MPLFPLEELENLPARPRLERDTEKLMRYASAEGWPLAKLTQPKMMNRSLRTLQRRARQFSLSFPDYIPRKLRKVSK